MITGKVQKTNLTAITWAHAVNSQKLLTDALKSNVDFIEADVVMGRVKVKPYLPIMAHPPDTISDLSLESFLFRIKQHNNNHTENMKGVKLDFKTIEVLEAALKTLEDNIPKMTYPIWLNADIIKGSADRSATEAVNPEKFLTICSRFDNAVLSIGWTTSWSRSVSYESYTNEDVKEMLKAIKNSNITQSKHAITFPVRATMAANSLNELQDLIKDLSDTNECTLTIWSPETDYVNVNNLRKLIFSFGFDRVFLDVPEQLSNLLNLSRPYDNSASNSVALSSFLNFSLITVGLVLIVFWLKKGRT